MRNSGILFSPSSSTYSSTREPACNVLKLLNCLLCLSVAERLFRRTFAWSWCYSSASFRPHLTAVYQRNHNSTILINRRVILQIRKSLNLTPRGSERFHVIADLTFLCPKRPNTSTPNVFPAQKSWCRKQYIYTRF